VKLRVKLFAGARQLAGAEEVEVEVPDEATVGQVREALIATCPPLATLAARAAMAVDRQYAADASRIQAGAELALIPPVSGG
jgi:molybdopterin converting factor subunit 1